MIVLRVKEMGLFWVVTGQSRFGPGLFGPGSFSALGCFGQLWLVVSS